MGMQWIENKKVWHEKWKEGGEGTLSNSVCYLQHYIYVHSGSVSPFVIMLHRKNPALFIFNCEHPLWHTVQGFS